MILCYAYININGIYILYIYIYIYIYFFFYDKKCIHNYIENCANVLYCCEILMF